VSEFSDSYHLMTDNCQAAEALLKRAGVEGYVFPAVKGWSALVAEGFAFRPNFQLIEANEGILLHLVSAQEYGWYFSLYQGPDQLAHYECYWENELYIHDAEFDFAKVKEVLSGQIEIAPEAAEEEYRKIFYPQELDYTCNPVTRLANLLGLKHVDWVAFSCVQEDQENNGGAFPARLIKQSE